MASSSSSNATTSDDKPNTLSNVVSNLVRASMGNSLSPTVTDEDLDRHVAELILREAKKKAEKYNQHGIRAYIASNLQDSNAPRTNKRFLTSIIRNTDDHNKAILKAQAEAAEEIKRIRREEEKKERRARAEEAVRARISGEKERKHTSTHSSHSRSHTSSRRSWREEREGSLEEGWDRWNGRTADREKERQKRKVRCWEVEDVGEEEKEGTRRRSKRTVKDRGKERERSRSRERYDKDRDRRRIRRKDLSIDGSKDKRKKQRRSRSASPRGCDKGERDNHRRKRYALDDLRDDDGSESDKEDLRRPPPSLNVPDDEVPVTSSSKLLNERTGRSRSRSASSLRPSNSKLKPTSRPISKRSSLSPSRTRSMSLSSRSSSPLLGPSPPPANLPSKMDKYFEESYDPRFDVAPLSVTPNIPATGLINDAEFEGWDAMLELIKLRRQDKEERKRLERLGLIDKDKKGKTKEKEKTKSGVVSSAGVIGSGGSLLDIEYKKRGSVREWDLGKEDLSF